MKITCPKCTAQQEIPDALIPKSGMVRCQACMNSIHVKSAARAAGLPSLQGLVTQEDEFTPPEQKAFTPGLPPTAPVVSPLRPPSNVPKGISDLPAPVGQSGGARRMPAGVSDLPAPVGQSGSARRMPPVSDLPAPVRRSGGAAKKGVDIDLIDLPGLPEPPRRRPPAVAAPPPPAAEDELELIDLPMPVEHQLPGLPESDLPAPVHAELPTPVHAELPMPQAPGLLTPVREGLELPPPLHPGRPASVTPPAFADSAMLGLVLEDLPPPPPRAGPLPGSLDSVRASLASSVARPAAASPRSASHHDDGDAVTRPILPGELPDQAGRAGLPQVSRESMLPVLGPNGEALDINPAEPEAAAGEDGPDGEEEGDEEGGDEAAGAPPLSRRRRVIFIAGGAVAALAVLAGAGLGLRALLSGHSKEDQAQLLRTRIFIGEDQTSSCRKGAEGAHSLVLNNPKDAEALSLEIQARLCLVRHGIAAEQRTADDRFTEIQDADRELPEAVKARALRALMRNQVGESRRLLETLPGRDKDSLAQVYLGWTELAGNKYAAADKAFNRALAINGKLVAAHLGLAQAKEAAGDRAAARKEYDKVVSLRADHFLGIMGTLRLSEDPGAETRMIETVKRLKANASDHEQAEVWAALGLRALESGRRPDAEDRLRKALAADATLPLAKVALARILCDLDKKEKYAEAVNLIRDVVKNDPRNVDAGLLMARALIGSQQPLSAGGQLDALAKLYPKDARVQYWQGRREEAVNAKDSAAKAEAHYRKAVDLDAKYLDAYIALSRVLQAEGKSTDALAALKQVATVAQADGDVAAALCSAYLGTQEYTQAAQSCRVALNLKPKLYRARMDLASALEGLGKTDAAVAELQALRSEVKDYPGLVERLGRLYLKLERYPEAEQAFLDAANQIGATTMLRVQAARLLLFSRPKDARPLLDRVLREDPRSGQARVNLARLILAESNNDSNQLIQAALLAEQANKLVELPEIHLVQAQVLLAQGKRPEAMPLLLQARRGVSEGRALLMHAQFLAADGGLTDALQEVSDLIGRQKAVLSDPFEYRPQDRTKILAAAYELQGDLLVKTGKGGEAIHAYEQAVLRNTVDAALAYRLARVLQAAGKQQPAMLQLRRALKQGGDKAPFAVEGYLMLGDMLKERHQRAEAVRVYQKWLELAPVESPERADIQAYVDRTSR